MGSESGGLDKKAEGVGAACLLSPEQNPSFSFFSVEEVTVEAGASSCHTQVCLVNHFQGTARDGTGDTPAPSATT